ncbi:type III-B CRISPR module-associated protein Cmr3 [Acidianus sp. HS-5]|uniref:type III-B CRISPR module-associated protein Cmr3 n=1 Tax=Acidianus sp. HS-5 TaxID=2886040 RepID=UPI001F032A0A|nr:type III-B CRISPR module-associated protein Cmr3 [Acidianus sp. HS-5]
MEEKIMIKISIKTVEPLMLRSQGEFGPLITGSHNFAQSLIIPRPSTIAGMLGSLAYDNLKTNLNNDWLVKLNHLLGNLTIYGTLVEVNEDYLFPLRLDNLFALVDQMDLSILYKMDELDEKHERWEKEIYDLFYEKNKLFDIIDFQNRIGIKIDKNTRTVKEHYLYSARYVSFKSNINYVIFIDGNDNLLGKINDEFMNLGGEGRVVKLKVIDECVPIDANTEYYLALSPILISDEILDDFLEKADKYIIMGKVDKISLGFDIGNKKRKEMLTAILEGSVIKKELIDFLNTIQSKTSSNYKIYEKIGYNTLTSLCQLRFRRK